MKIRITKSVGIEGIKIKPGTILEAPEPLAKSLIDRDRAELVGDEETAEVVTEDGPKFLGSSEQEEAAKPAKPSKPARR